MNAMYEHEQNIVVKDILNAIFNVEEMKNNKNNEAKLGSLRKENNLNVNNNRD